MSGFSMNVALDAASLATLHNFSNYQALLEPELLKAMDRGISLLQATATDEMYNLFQNPTGQAEEAWDTSVQSAYLAIAANTAPYAQRLDYGFSGLTDSLGRYFPYWPAYYWAESTVMDAADQVAAQFQAAIDYANLALGGGIP